MTLLEETEKEMIDDTRERAFLFSPDGNTILLSKEAYEGEDVLKLSKDECKLCKGNILTHSHTEAGYRTFTNLDVGFYFSTKLKEIRMVRGRTVSSLIHKGNCKHASIMTEMAKWDIEHGVSEDGTKQFLGSLSCLSLIEQSMT